MTGYFDRTVATLNDATEKLDDKMEPLTPEQCGSVLRTTDEEKNEYRNLSYQKISEGKVNLLSIFARKIFIFAGFPTQVSLPSSSWLVDKVPGLASAIPRGCTTLDSPPGRHSSSYRLRGSSSCRCWPRLPPERKVVHYEKI